jgi:6-phospho-beta-glucosidase
MARIKIAYVGGGSTRAAGTMASFIEQGENFAGSEIALIDLDEARLALVKTLADKMLRARGLDLTVTATTDRRAGLDGCDAVLSSFRPGGFEARALDERIPLRYGVIGQETQGPGGFFMALRSITAMKAILDDMAAACPSAWIFNYTNPVNVVAQAVSDHSDVPIVALCEGPIVYPQYIAQGAGLDPDKLDVRSVGLNHGSWSVEHTYDGEPLPPILRDAWEERHDDPNLSTTRRRLLWLAATMGSVPSSYFQYYYFEREILAELQSKPTTRAEDILASVPDYWAHYREQAASDDPVLDPARSRGGIHELELAIDCMDAIYNDRDETMPVNVPCQGTVPGFPDGLVVETVGRCHRGGIEPLAMPGLPSHVNGLVESLAAYQQAAADAAWDGDHRDATRALASNPLVRSLDVAERMYREMAHAHRAYLPDRLVP